MIKFIVFIVLFLGLAAGAFAQDFEVTGIIFQKEPVAIINGTIVKVGEEIDGALVVRILDKSVFLKHNGELIIKNLTGKRLPQEVKEDIDKKLSNEKSSKANPTFFLFVLILIVGGAGLYLFGKNKRAAGVEQ